MSVIYPTVSEQDDFRYGSVVDLLEAANTAFKKSGIVTAGKFLVLAFEETEQMHGADVKASAVQIIAEHYNNNRDTYLKNEHNFG